MKKLLWLLLLIPLTAFGIFDDPKKYYVGDYNFKNFYIVQTVAPKSDNVRILRSKTPVQDVYYIVLKPDSLPKGLQEDDIIKYQDVYLAGYDEGDLCIVMTFNAALEYIGGDFRVGFYPNSDYFKKIKSDFDNFYEYKFKKAPRFYYMALVKGETYCRTKNWSIEYPRFEPAGITNMNAYYPMLIPVWDIEKN